MIELTPDQIDLWLAFSHEDDDESSLASYRTLLSTAEKRQETRLHFAKDRRQYLLTRALVRTVMSRYAPIRPEDWAFSTNAQGRPEIANPPGHEPPLSFNLSHSQHLVVLGVTRGRALGVDVENVRDQEAPMDVVRAFFSPPEADALAALPPAQQHDRFFEYWTLKESYMKARGLGLSIQLSEVGFRFLDDRTVDMVLQPQLADDASRWQFWQFRPAPEYLVAVCTERHGATRPELVVRKVALNFEEELLFPTFLRTPGCAR